MRLNLDETNVAFFYPHARGTIIHRKRKLPNAERPVQKVKREKLRTNFTHVGLVCDQTHLQPLMPQLLIFNKKHVTKAQLETVRLTLPPNIYVMLSCKAWSSARIHAALMVLLGQVLEPFLDEWQPLLTLDTAGIHLDEEAIARAFDANIWYCVIPAGCTWLLQPLDTHGFMRYKADLRRRMADAFSAESTVDVLFVVPLVCETIRTVLQGTKWALSFSEDGFGNRQQSTSQYIRRQLELDGFPEPMPALMPTLEQLTSILPQNRKYQQRTYLREWFPLGPALPAIVPLEDVPAPEAPVPPPPLPPPPEPPPAAPLRRLRSKSRIGG